MSVPSRLERPATRRGLLAWALFDWANSPTPTIVITFIFAPYFARAVVGDETRGLELWSWGMAFSAFVIAVISPVVGAIADAAGRRKPWVGGFTLLTIAATALLWFAAPEPAWIVPTLLLVVLVNIGFETATVFYNAMLPDLAEPARMGRLSGWAWGLGYAGGIACLALVLVVFILPETAPFGLDDIEGGGVRIAGPLAALWLIVFGWPMFVLTPDRPSARLPVATAVRRGLARLVETGRELGRHVQVLRFLAARLLYIDGLNTLFALGGVYAAAAFGMDEKQVLIFAICLNVTAGLGAAAFAWLDDLVGSKQTIAVSLLCLAVSGGALLVVEDVLWFWILGMVLGIFIGPVQSASRSLMARMAPPEMTGEMFGFFALSGKVTSFLGPLLVGIVTALTGSARWGMSVIVVLMLAGLAILMTVKVERQHTRLSSSDKGA
jgi:UMF1 family MFS transporter